MSKENLFSEEAKSKVKELAESIDFAMFTSNLNVPPYHTIPMSTKKVDEMGNIWFLSGRTSDHNKNIEKDSNVLLNYSKSGDMQFLCVYATASIVLDKAIIKELYGSTDDAWFDGVDDPNVSALKISPQEAHYWEPKNGKIVTLLKMGVGAVTGKKQDPGVEGDLMV